MLHEAFSGEGQCSWRRPPSHSRGRGGVEDNVKDDVGARRISRDRGRTPENLDLRSNGLVWRNSRNIAGGKGAEVRQARELQDVDLRMNREARSTLAGVDGDIVVACWTFA